VSRAIVWSYGGGKQTAAIAVLIARGLLPKPDVAVMANTMRENPATFAYLEDHVRPLLAGVGVDVVVVDAAEGEPSIYAGNGDLLIPAHTTTGRLPTFCSDRWKFKVIGRYLRSVGYGPDRPVVEWLGFSTDEAHRAKASPKQWRQRAFPLLTMWPMRRDECVALVRAAGLPDPPKSRCFDCPHQSNAEWREVRDTTPHLYQLAIARDDAIRAADGRGGVFLHGSRQPLADIDLDAAEASGDLFHRCTGAGCFT
jgi:hypothetical protein